MRSSPVTVACHRDHCEVFPVPLCKSIIPHLDWLVKPLAITIVAGLLASAAFKLIGIPVVYELVGRTRWGTVVQSKSFLDGDGERE